MSVDYSSRPAPWHPRVALIIALLFSWAGGGLIVYQNFARMGRAHLGRELLINSLLATLALILLALLFTPTEGTQLLILLLDLVGSVILYRLQLKPFQQWAKDHPQVMPSSGWTSLGWGLLGAVIAMGLAFFTSLVVASIGFRPS
ncbi:MAG TPA: hypothetical protein ENI60_08855 [Candidatus Fraserbacteria bacterium]|nr:hypothetical protein [Candidatus Fraserbacteria bacterium]